MHGGFKEGARTALSACWSAPFSETRGQGCPRSFRALLESAVGKMSQNVTRKGGFNKRSRRREKADFCKQVEFRLLTSAATAIWQIFESANVTRLDLRGNSREKGCSQ